MPHDTPQQLRWPILNFHLSSRFWQTVNTILHRRPSNILPFPPPTSSLADKFASFFSEKITKRKSPNSTLLRRQQLTPHRHTLNHLLYHLNVALSALPQLTISPDSSINHRTNSAILILFLCLSSSSAATFLHRLSQTLSICLFPLVNFHLSSNRLLSLLWSRNQALTENHYLTTGQSLIFPFSQNLPSLLSGTAFMNNCHITPCSIFSNMPTQSLIPLNLPCWWSTTIS
jgi:hypothetical protein